MKRTIACLTFVAAMALSGVAQAQSSKWRSPSTGGPQASRQPAQPSSPVVGISGSMNGAFTTALSPCTVGFANQCPSADCSCYTVTGTAALSKLGKGPATLSATLDFGSGITSGGGDCFPAYLEFDVTTPKDAETWSGVGSACDSVDGHGSPLTGGFGLQTSTVYTGAIVQFTMTPNFPKSTFKVKFSGKAER